MDKDGSILQSFFLNEEEDFYKHQNQKVLTFENLQRHGLTILASCPLYLPYDLVMGLWVVRNVTLKPALENRVYCKDNEGSHKCRKNISNQALGRTEKKNRFKIVSLSPHPFSLTPFPLFTLVESDLWSLWPEWLHVFIHLAHESFAGGHLSPSLQDLSFKQPPPIFF